MAKKRVVVETKTKTVHAPGEPVYTVMAFVTFVALAIGCILLYLDYDEYGKKAAPSEKVPALSKLGDVAPGGPAPAPTPTPTAP